MMVSKGKNQLKTKITTFLRQYGRKAEHGYDPNDRGYDRKIEELIKKMDPEELDKLMHDD